MRNKNRRSGVAMIMVLVMIVIFAALILAVVISSSAAIRRAHYYKDKAVALQIAQAGLQEVLYWMNHKGYYYHNYPCTNPFTYTYDPAYKYFQGSDWTGSDTWTTTEPSNYNPTNILQGRCVVTFTDNNNENEDEIISTGYYRGRSASISVKLRGSNGEGNNGIHPWVPSHNSTYRWLTDWDGVNMTTGVATWGIPEAFNKHTIYAREVEVGSSPNPKITGNIFTYNTINLISTAAGQYTVTKVATAEVPAYFDYLTKPETEIYRNDIPTTPSINVYFIHPAGYTPNKVYAYRNDDGTYDDTVLGDHDSGVTGITYNGTDYTFTDTQIEYPFSVIGESTTRNAGAIFAGIGNNHVSKYVRIAGNMTISANITTATDKQSAFEIGGTCTVNASVTITGDLVVKKAATITIGNNVTINGALIADEINGNVTCNGLSIDATASQYKAGVFVNTTGDINIPVNSFTIGNNQNAGIVAYSSGGNVNVTANADMNNTYFQGKATIVAYASSDSKTSKVTINSEKKIKGLIYSRTGTTSLEGILLRASSTAPQIVGAIVTNGKVRFESNCNDQVSYDSAIYNDIQNHSNIYPNFKGGRRRYVPVPGSWRIIW